MKFYNSKMMIAAVFLTVGTVASWSMRQEEIELRKQLQDEVTRLEKSYSKSEKAYYADDYGVKLLEKKFDEMKQITSFEKHLDEAQKELAVQIQLGAKDDPQEQKILKRLQKEVARFEKALQQTQNSFKDKGDHESKLLYKKFAELHHLEDLKKHLDEAKKELEVQIQFDEFSKQERKLHLQEIRETALQRQHERRTAIRELERTIERKGKMHMLQIWHSKLMKAVTEGKMCQHKTLGEAVERQLLGFEKEMDRVKGIKRIIDQVKRVVLTVRKIKRSISKKLGPKQFEQLEAEYLDIQKQVNRIASKENKALQEKWDEISRQRNTVVGLNGRLIKEARKTEHKDADRMQTEIKILAKINAVEKGN